MSYGLKSLNMIQNNKEDEIMENILGKKLIRNQLVIMYYGLLTPNHYWGSIDYN